MGLFFVTGQNYAKNKKMNIDNIKMKLIVTIAGKISKVNLSKAN
jgi:hypothetical protein